MKITEFAAPLRQLIIRFRAWDDGVGNAVDDAEAGLSQTERAALLDELRSLVADAESARSNTPWRALAGLFSSSAPTSIREGSRLQRDLLRSYEQLCELDLPFQVSSTLLRHYSAIRRAAHVADGRLNLPTPPRGFAVGVSEPTPGTMR